MRRELTTDEIIRAGRAYAARRAWEQARTFAQALYGQTAASISYSEPLLPEEDHRLSPIVVLTFGRAGTLLPYDFSTRWRARYAVPEEARRAADAVTSEGVMGGLGGGLPQEIRDGLRAFAEECLGVETLHTWRTDEVGEARSWMFDLTTMPPAVFAELVDDTGEVLTAQDVVAAGIEREALARWAGAREYVRTLYGEDAIRADVVMYSSYNDETYNRRMQFQAYDREGARLFFNLRLPWWDQFEFSDAQVARYIEEQMRSNRSSPD